MSPELNALRIEPAIASDRPAITALLREAGLPHDDVAEPGTRFFVARNGSATVGAIGAEVYGGDALLRSLVVAPACRKRGLGGRLVDALESAAEGWGVERWWLLTATAERFFAARGFVVVPRASAPPAIRATSRFDGHCASAVCMTRTRREAS